MRQSLRHFGGIQALNVFLFTCYTKMVPVLSTIDEAKIELATQPAIIAPDFPQQY